MQYSLGLEWDSVQTNEGDEAERIIANLHDGEFEGDDSDRFSEESIDSPIESDEEQSQIEFEEDLIDPETSSQQSPQKRRKQAAVQLVCDFFSALEENPTLSANKYHATYAMERHPTLPFISKAAFHVWVSKVRAKKESIEQLYRCPGRPRALLPEKELEIVDRCLWLRNKYNILTKEMILGEAYDVAILPSFPGESLQARKTRFHNVGGPYWIRHFRERHHLTVWRTKRPLEIERALKSQPEIILEYFRMYAYVSALLQIHRFLAADPSHRVEGWLLRAGGLVTRQGDVIGSDPLPSHPILGVKQKQIWNLALNKPLMYTSPSHVFNLDEKPIIPDSPDISNVGTAVAYGRTGSWTLTPVINANGALVSASIILRGQKVPEGMNHHKYDTFTTETGITNDDVFYKTLEKFIPLSNVNRRQPGLLILDGHISRLTSRVGTLAMSNNLYIMVIPSHTSTISQQLDNGCNAFIERTYREQYTAKAVMVSKRIVQGGSGMTNIDRIECLWQTLNLLGGESGKKISQGSWMKTGIPGGVLVPGKMPLRVFEVGLPFRSDQDGTNLPQFSARGPKEQLSRKFLTRLYSSENIAALPFSPISLDFSLEDKLEHKFAQTLRDWNPMASPDPERIKFEYSYARMTSDNGAVALLYGRKDSTQLLQSNRGAASRLSTVGGVLLTGEANQVLITANENARNIVAATAAENAQARNLAIVQLMPVIRVFRILEIISPSSENLIADHLNRFYDLHSGCSFAEWADFARWSSLNKGAKLKLVSEFIVKHQSAILVLHEERRLERLSSVDSDSPSSHPLPSISNLLLPSPSSSQTSPHSASAFASTSTSSSSLTLSTNDSQTPINATERSCICGSTTHFRRSFRGCSQFIQTP